MIEAYSQNITVAANQAIPFNGVALKKGCTAELVSPATIQFNKCGVYMVACGVSAGAASTIQLYKDGVPQPQARRTGTSPSFVTLVIAQDNNNNCPCTIPTTIQVVSSTGGTFADAEITVTRVC